MNKRIILMGVVSLAFPVIMAQLPGFENMMNNIGNIGNMVNNMQTTMFQMAQENMRRSTARQSFGAGEHQFTTANGGRGFVYNSPDGSSSSYSFSSGGPSSGFVYHFGPDGTFERRW